MQQTIDRLMAVRPALRAGANRIRAAMPRFETRWVLLGFAVTILAAWGGALQCWFASDDFLWLDIARPGPTLASFVSGIGVKFDFHPITRLVLLADWELWGVQPWGWHLVNLLLHGGCVALAWLLARRWLPESVAVAGALLFAANPVLPENTLWISGMTASLSTLLGLVSVLCFDRWLRERRGWLLAASFAADLAAMAAYEPMIVLPLAHTVLGWRHYRVLIALYLCHGALLGWRSFVLGSHTLNPGPAYHLQWPDSHHLALIARDYWAFHIFFLVLPWLLVPGLLALLWRRRLALAVLMILAAMLVVMAPYALFSPGGGSRYFYTASIGLGLIEAICMWALAAALPWGRMPVFGLLCLAMLGAEIRQARAETRDWIAAGQLGQRLVAALQAADPAPDPQALHILLDMPMNYGNGELFTTYPDHAFRRFTRLPFDALMTLPQYAWRTGAAELFFLRKRQIEEDQYLASQHQAPLWCLDRAAARAVDLASYLRNAAPCGIDALLYRDGVFIKLTPEEFRLWYARNGKRVQGG